MANISLEDARDYYVRHSTKASDVARQLSLAGLAVVWIFKSDQGGGVYAVPHALMWPSLILVAALFSDLMQYVWGSLVWGAFQRIKEKQILASRALNAQRVAAALNPAEPKPGRPAWDKLALPEAVSPAPDETFLAPAWFNRPTNVFFWSKLGLVVVAYALLGVFMFSAVHH
jgi:hypothetical protein